jgi:hypothetical protein
MVTPVFSILDYHEAMAFYIGWLGFRIDWEDQPKKAPTPVYIQVSKGDIVLHLQLYQGANPPLSKAIAEIRGLPFYHQQLLQQHNAPQQPMLEKAFWNEKVLGTEVIDPFGNTLVFYEPAV